MGRRALHKYTAQHRKRTAGTLLLAARGMAHTNDRFHKDRAINRHMLRIMNLIPYLNRFTNAISVPARLQEVLLTSMGTHFQVNLTLEHVLNRSDALRMLHFIVIRHMNMRITILNRVASTLHRLRRLIRDRITGDTIRRHFNGMLRMFILLYREGILMSNIRRMFNNILTNGRDTIKRDS